MYVMNVTMHNDTSKNQIKFWNNDINHNSNGQLGIKIMIAKSITAAPFMHVKVELNVME